MDLHTLGGDEAAQTPQQRQAADLIDAAKEVFAFSGSSREAPLCVLTHTTSMVMLPGTTYGITSSLQALSYSALPQSMFCDTSQASCMQRCKPNIMAACCGTHPNLLVCSQAYAAASTGRGLSCSPSWRAWSSACRQCCQILRWSSCCRCDAGPRPSQSVWVGCDYGPHSWQRQLFATVCNLRARLVAIPLGITVGFSACTPSVGG